MKRSKKTSWIVSAVIVVATLAAAAFLFVPRPIRLAELRTGDAELLQAIGEPDGHRRLSVASIDLRDATPVRFAGLGANPQDRFEAGSLAKAVTGLVLADAVRRGEVQLDAPVSRYLELGDSAAGQVSLAELATHHAGYPRLGSGTFWRGLLTGYTAGNPYVTTTAQLTDEVRTASLSDRGTYAYSNLGAATAGQAVASATRTSFRDLMQQRLFAPLGMNATEIADRPIVEEGLTEVGRRSAPWVMDGYAPAGGMVSSSADPATLATALLRDRAPGMAALDPRAAAGETASRRIGLFWQLSQVEADGGARTVTWHNGATGGYTAFLGLDRERQRAIVVLSDTATSVDDLGIRLLTR